jgi:hypothetical protein
MKTKFLLLVYTTQNFLNVLTQNPTFYQIKLKTLLYSARFVSGSHSTETGYIV